MLHCQEEMHQDDDVVASLGDYIRDLQLNGYTKNGKIEVSDDFLNICNDKNGNYCATLSAESSPSPPPTPLITRSSTSTIESLQQTEESRKSKYPFDFDIRHQQTLNDTRFDQFEMFPPMFNNNGNNLNLLSRCFSSSLQEISDESNSTQSCNLLPRPATAGSVNDFQRSQEYQQYDNLNSTKYNNTYLLEQTFKYINSIKNGSSSWGAEPSSSPPPPGLSTPPSTSPAAIWDNSQNGSDIFLNSSNSWSQFKTYNSPVQQLPAPPSQVTSPILQPTNRQLPTPIGRKSDSRSDYLLQAVNALSLPINNNPSVNRPLRSQRVDIRILYAMMYRALANGLAGGRREVCVFCRNNGEHELIYTSHSLKDSRNKVTCPILRAYQCPICLSTGDKAHTIKYCPYNSDSSITQDTPLEKLFRYVNSQQQPQFNLPNFSISNQNQNFTTPNGMTYSSQDLQTIIQNNNHFSCGILNNQSNGSIGVTDLLVNLVGQANTLTNNSNFDHNTCYPSPLLNSLPPRTFRS